MNLEVYKITNNKNGKIYIGITNQGATTHRWWKHCSDAKGSSDFPIHNAIRKYGKENFQIEVIETVDDVEVLYEREIYWIKFYNSYNRKKGYNLTLGGDGTFGRYHSEKTKDKIRQKAFNGVRSIESKRKQSVSMKENNIFDHEEMSRRAKNGNKKRWSNPDNRFKQSVNNINNKVVLKYSLSGEFIESFYNVSEAARSIGKTHGNISSCALGKIKTAYGFIWKYKKY